MISVRLFAGLRERAGWSQREVEAATVADVWPALGLGDEPSGLLYAVNKEYAPRERELADGDEVALIPPVSGGAFLLSDEALSLDRVVDEVRDHRAGAIATFTGTTRNRSRDRDVQYLDYEAYEGMAEGLMSEIAAQLTERYDLCAIAIHHRTGRVQIGETSVVIAVSAPHRADALAACKDAIDELKQRVPLWKKEVYAGGEEWIGAGIMSEYHDYEPLQPARRDWRETLKRAFGPLIAAAIALAKFSFVLVKFGSIFITIGFYALAFGWTFGIGFVLLILFHELGHYIEARREGLGPKLPVFIPFLGAYVKYTRGHPWQTVKVAIAGPILGGLAALACYVVGKSRGSDQLLALAHLGFLLNLVNLIPVWILDGGAIWRSARWLRLGGGRGKAAAAYALLFGTAALLVLGMVVSHVPRSRV